MYKDFNDEFDKELKNSYINHLTNLIVEQFLIYKKYLNINELNYNHIVRYSKEGIYLSNAENSEVIKKSKEILKNTYGLLILTDDPITLKSHSITYK